MAVLNPNSGNNVSDSTNSAQAQGQEQDVAREPQARRSAGGPSDALNEGSSFLGDANGFLNQLNQLLQNPIVQQRLEDKMGGQSQPEREQVMDSQASERQELEGNTEKKKKETPQTREIRPEDIDTIEVFQAKLFDEEQRQELTQGLEQIGALVDDELQGMDTTLEELKEYLESEEFEKQVEQLKEAGMA